METPVLTVRLPKTEHHRISRVAAYYGLTRSEWIRAVLERALAETVTLSTPTADLCPTQTQNSNGAISSAPLSRTI